MITKGEELERTTVGLPGDLLAKGRAKAKEGRRSFSSYLSVLVERDLQKDRLEAQKKEKVEV